MWAIKHKVKKESGRRQRAAMSAGIIYILSLRAITFPAPLVSIDQLQHPTLPLALSWGKMIPPPATHPKMPGLNTLDLSTAVSQKSSLDKWDFMVFLVPIHFFLLKLKIYLDYCCSLYKLSALCDHTCTTARRTPSVFAFGCRESHPSYEDNVHIYIYLWKWGTLCRLCCNCDR